MLKHADLHLTNDAGCGEDNVVAIPARFTPDNIHWVFTIRYRFMHLRCYNSTLAR